jgi:hypothetical protein
VRPHHDGGSSRGLRQHHHRYHWDRGEHYDGRRGVGQRCGGVTRRFDAQCRAPTSLLHGVGRQAVNAPLKGGQLTTTTALSKCAINWTAIDQLTATHLLSRSDVHRH